MTVLKTDLAINMRLKEIWKLDVTKQYIVENMFEQEDNSWVLNFLISRLDISVKA